MLGTQTRKYNLVHELGWETKNYEDPKLNPDR